MIMGTVLKPIATCLAGISFAVSAGVATASPDDPKPDAARSTKKLGAYADIGPLHLYFEIHGSGFPLVLIHGGGSTIETSFGHMIPTLAKTHRVIAIEEQGHGRTPDVDRPVSFTQTADDVAALLDQLDIAQADVMGFSNGGSTALQVGIRHPQRVRKIVAISAIYRRDGMFDGFFDMMKNATLADMPAELQEAYRAVAPKPEDLQKMHDKDLERMLGFVDWPDAQLRGITAPTLVMIGDRDVVKPEHAVAMYRLLPNAQLAIVPDADHAAIVQRPVVQLQMIEDFLAAPMPPTANAKSDQGDSSR
jgi:pimeloyl-ACP methyl ester carboxylesterase